MPTVTPEIRDAVASRLGHLVENRWGTAEGEVWKLFDDGVLCVVFETYDSDCRIKHDANYRVCSIFDGQGVFQPDFVDFISHQSEKEGKSPGLYLNRTRSSNSRVNDQDFETFHEKFLETKTDYDIPF